jgi:hypothetical protein
VRFGNTLFSFRRASIDPDQRLHVMVSAVERDLTMTAIVQKRLLSV